jgi:hypothetical protein
MLLLSATAASLDAQVPRTGAATTTTCAAGISVCDVNWSVRWFALSGSNGGFLSNAAIIPAVGGVWAPNEAGVQQWIGAASGGSVGYASRYYFQTTFTSDISQTLDFGLGWDNRLVGAYVGGGIDLATGLFVGGTSLLPGTSPATPYADGRAGFCRDADGVFPTSQFPDCVLNVAIGVNAGQANVLTFVVEGDGTTDGFLLGLAEGANTPPVITVPATTVPEPTTVVLSGAGLALLGLAQRWRRKRG